MPGRNKKHVHYTLGLLYLLMESDVLSQESEVRTPDFSTHTCLFYFTYVLVVTSCFKFRSRHEADSLTNMLYFHMLRHLSRAHNMYSERSLFKKHRKNTSLNTVTLTQ